MDRVFFSKSPLNRMYELTSMTFWCFNSLRNLTSRMADMSRPSLNCPTLIFLIATFRPLEASRPGGYQANWTWSVGRRTLVYDSIGTFAHLSILDPSNSRAVRDSEQIQGGEDLAIVSDEQCWPFRQHPWRAFLQGGLMRILAEPESSCTPFSFNKIRWGEVRNIVTVLSIECTWFRTGSRLARSDPQSLFFNVLCN